MYEFTIMEEDKRVAHVVLNEGKLVSYEHLEKESVYFYRKELKLGFEQIYSFLEERFFPRNRENIDEILGYYGVEQFNLYELCKLSHGLMVNDNVWLRYPGDDLTWEDIVAWRS